MKLQGLKLEIQAVKKQFEDNKKTHTEYSADTQDQLKKLEEIKKTLNSYERENRNYKIQKEEYEREINELRTLLQQQGSILPERPNLSEDLTQIMQQFRQIYDYSSQHGGSKTVTQMPMANDRSHVNEQSNANGRNIESLSILYNAITWVLLKYNNLLNDGLLIKLRYIYTLPNYDTLFDKVHKAIDEKVRIDFKVEYIMEKLRFFLTYTYVYQDTKSLKEQKYTELGYDAFEQLLDTSGKINITQEKNAIILCEDANELLIKYIEINKWEGHNVANPSVYKDFSFVYTYIDQLILKMQDISVILSNLQLAKGDIIREIDSHLDDKIITYVKFRHGNSQKDQINERNMFFYMSDKEIKYQGGSDGFALQKLPLYMFTRNDPIKYYDEKGKSKTIELSPFTDLYSFGPFHRVFEGSTNQAVGENMTEVTSKLMKGENVFIMGYGASGAGKTSTLIEFQPPGQREPTPGALVYMLQYLAKLQGSPRRNKATLQITELFQGGTINKFNGPIVIGYLEDKKGWVVTEYGSYTDPITIQNEIKGYDAKDFLPREESVDIDTLLSTILSQAVNKSRLSRGTVNNPQSSRSHIIIDIHFDTGPHLFVGDFAGVEQKFNYEFMMNVTHNGKYGPAGDTQNSLDNINKIFKNGLKHQNFRDLFLEFEDITGGIDDNMYETIQKLMALLDNDKIKYELNPEIYSLIRLKYQKSDKESFAYPYYDIIEKKIDETTMQNRFNFIQTHYNVSKRIKYTYSKTVQEIYESFTSITQGTGMNSTDLKALKYKYEKALGIYDEYESYLYVKIPVKFYLVMLHLMCDSVK